MCVIEPIVLLTTKPFLNREGLRLSKERMILNVKIADVDTLSDIYKTTHHKKKGVPGDIKTKTIASEVGPSSEETTFLLAYK